MLNLNAWKPVTAVLLRELAVTVALLFGVSLVIFLILYAAPGDPFAALLGGRMLSDSERAAAYEALGISQSWYGQYLSWLGKLLVGGFALALIETLSAKMRIFRAPEFLGTAFLLAVLAMLVNLLLGS